MSAVQATPASQVSTTKTVGKRVNGKFWHERKTPLRLTAGLTSYEKRKQKDQERTAMKAREKEMKDEKEAERRVCCSPTSLSHQGTDHA